MIDLYKFILEAVQKANGKLEQLYNLSPNADLSRCPKNLRSSNKHRHEFLRGYFGDDEESAVNSVKEMLSKIGVNDVDFEYGMYKDSSGSYCSIKVIAKDKIDNSEYGLKLNKGDFVYIVNTAVGNSKIRKKTLTPDALGLTDDEFSSRDQIKNAVIKGLKANKLEEYEKAIISLCDCITGGENDLTLDEIINHTISYTVAKDTLGELTESDFNNLANDFGEVLGPMMLMDKLDGDVVLSYPKGSNAKLYDYCINDTIWISAKAGARGAVPSAVDTMKAIQGLYDKGIIDKEGCSKDEAYYLENIVPIIADDEKKESGSAIRRQTWRLAIEIREQGYATLDEALKTLEKYGLTISENGIPTEDIDKVQSSGKLEEMMRSFYATLNYKPSSKFPLETMDSEWSDYDKDAKEGIVLYPIKVCVTKFINAKYGEYITKYANMVMTGYQMYFNHKMSGNNVELSFCAKQMSKNNFELSAQGSVGKPLLKSMGIVMTH